MSALVMSQKVEDFYREFLPQACRMISCRPNEVSEEVGNAIDYINNVLIMHVIDICGVDKEEAIDIFFDLFDMTFDTTISCN